MKAFVVMGAIGEYSDRRTWPVRVFFDRFEADAFALHAHEHLVVLSADEDFVERLENQCGPYDGYDEDHDRLTLFDPTLSRTSSKGVRCAERWCEYGGAVVAYGVIEVDAADLPEHVR